MAARYPRAFMVALCSAIILGGCARQSCEIAGLKWAATTNTCISRQCATDGTCGQWANPSAWCEKIELGQSKDEVVFWLGNPAETTETTASWPVDKVTTNSITATFESGKLVGFDCPN